MCHSRKGIGKHAHVQYIHSLWSFIHVGRQFGKEGCFTYPWTSQIHILCSHPGKSVILLAWMSVVCQMMYKWWCMLAKCQCLSWHILLTCSICLLGVILCHIASMDECCTSNDAEMIVHASQCPSCHIWLYTCSICLPGVILNLRFTIQMWTLGMAEYIWVQ